MRILVTGGAGFQGSHLSRALLERGHRVAILNTWSQQSEGNVRRFELGEAALVWGSVTDPQTVDKTVRDHDVVCHLAANVHVDESRGDPRSFLDANVTGTYHVLEACRRRRTPLLHVSTCEVYGGCGFCPQVAECPRPRLIRESCPLKPQSPYAASKAGAEALVFAYGVTYEMRSAIARPGNVFGPGQRCGVRGAVIPRFIRQALAGQDLTVYGSGGQGRDFVYVADLVRAYLLLVELLAGDRPLWRVVNVGTGASTSVNEIARAVCEATGNRSRIVHVDRRPGEVAGFELDGSRMKGLGFELQAGFADGLTRTIQWFAKEATPCASA